MRGFTNGKGVRYREGMEETRELSREKREKSILNHVSEHFLCYREMDL